MNTQKTHSEPTVNKQWTNSENLIYKQWTNHEQTGNNMRKQCTNSVQTEEAVNKQLTKIEQKVNKQWTKSEQTVNKQWKLSIFILIANFSFVLPRFLTGRCSPYCPMVNLEFNVKSLSQPIVYQILSIATNMNCLCNLEKYLLRGSCVFSHQSALPFLNC